MTRVFTTRSNLAESACARAILANLSPVALALLELLDALAFSPFAFCVIAVGWRLPILPILLSVLWSSA